MMATLGSIVLAALLFALFGMLRFPSGCAGNCAGDCGHCGTVDASAVDASAIDATAIGANTVGANNAGANNAGAIPEVRDDHD